jgi:hypothetical protein
MAKAHDRILELTLVADESGDSVAVSDVKYYRDRAQLDAANGFDVAFSGGADAVTPVEIELGETVPPPTHIRLAFTFQA